ncbi:MAG: MBL fold metallo-hydrolase [Rhodoferax sp.]
MSADPALSIPSDTAAWDYEHATALCPGVWRLTAPNSGMMTGPGTNSYLLGDVQHGFVVIDPGPDLPEHIQRLWQACAHPDGSGGHITHIVCTHSHPDHAPGAWPLRALCPRQPEVLGLASLPTARANSRFTPTRSLQNQERIALVLRGPGADSTPQPRALEVLHTPGHAANHVCLLLASHGLLFSGDHILQGSTTVIDPPDGDMHDYLDSLHQLSQRCAALGLRQILSAHGRVIDDAQAAIAHLVRHRLQREAKVAAAMAARPQGGLQDWVALAYDDVDPGLWPLALRSLQAHVQRLQRLQNTPTEAP